MDNYILVEHGGPHCGSRQFYNGILDDHAHVCVTGASTAAERDEKTDELMAAVGRLMRRR